MTTDELDELLDSDPSDLELDELEQLIDDLKRPLYVSGRLDDHEEPPIKRRLPPPAPA